MVRMLKISAIITMALILNACTVLSRGQVESLRETANNLEHRAKLNERGKEFLVEDLGPDHGAIKIIEQNTEFGRSAAETIRNVVGRGDD